MARTLLRHRDFGLLCAGMTVSLLGDGISFVAIAWLVYDLSDSATALSLVGLAWSLGMALCLLPGGVVSDRLDRRRVMVAADVAGLVASAAAQQPGHVVGEAGVADVGGLHPHDVHPLTRG